MAINNFQKFIYNAYLKNSRKDQPIKFRKDFKNLNEEILLFLNKLELFFKKFKHINVEEFFRVPLEINPEEKYPYINFFCTRQAIKLYQIFLRNKQLRPLKEQLSEIKKTLEFITNFCLANKISLKDYTSFKEENSHMPVWSKHYRDHLLNTYALIDVIDWRKFDELQFDEKELWFPGLQSDLNYYKINYNNSKDIKFKIQNIISNLNKLTLTTPNTL